ncbi:MAG: hypothetical protein PHD76_00675 [Methylacidiphilales bacterium]|nr:hypothetical protein [Candidatus Methylacidiphilales bacterium]
MSLLNEIDYRRTFLEPMIRIEGGENPSFDFWPYVEGIPKEDYGGYDCSDGSVNFVWRSSDARYEHVLINTKEDKDVFMVIILDRSKKTVVGHRLLDLKMEYGLRD